MRSNIIQQSWSNLLPIAVLLAGGMLLAGCVTPIPIAQEAPDLNYKVTRPVVVAVVDERDVLAAGKPPTFIGRGARCIRNTVRHGDLSVVRVRQGQERPDTGAGTRGAHRHGPQ